ncbi:MAG: C40 family peptidase [Candidatus Omnitrophica bacterium]|nr:C40 family peptidase [Candidatus Omnitrophota bacterium]
MKTHPVKADAGRQPTPARTPKGAGVGLAISFLIWLLPATSATIEAAPRRMRVAVPVADLRREPGRAGPTLEQDPLEESQLLYGDPVEVQEIKEGWARVSAVEQMEWTHHKRWEGYPGWIELENLIEDPGNWNPNLVVTAKQGKVLEKPGSNTPARFLLSIGTRLAGTPDGNGWNLRLLDGTTGWISGEEIARLEKLAEIRKEDPARWRARLVQTARLFLGDPYYWGGRSAANLSGSGTSHTAVDCSGLAGLVYQANGMIIPRDAHEIWMQAWPISPEQLLPGDLIFLNDPKDPQRVSHVMIYLYENKARIIESPGTGKLVRELPLSERLKEAKGRRIFFGTYLPQ